MPVVSFRHDRTQIIIPIAVLPPELDPNPNRAIQIRALIDTGASASGIPLAVAQSLGLPKRGKEIIKTAGGEYPARLFQFRIGIYIAGEVMPRVIAREFIGIDCRAGEDFDALLGMDVLGSGNLQIWRDGSGSFAFD